MTVDSPEFTRGVRYFLSTQKDTGEWASVNSQSSRPSAFTPTMWAVIGLAGSYRTARPTLIALDKSILFDFDRYNLKPDAQAALAEIERSVIEKHPGARLIIMGHTDDVGTDQYNLALSDRRARAVADWLTGDGVNRRRFETVGFGKAHPRCTGTDEQSRACNRRVEISMVEEKP